MEQELTTYMIKIFECKIRDQMKAIHHSPFLNALVYGYIKRTMASYFSTSISNNDLFYYIDLPYLYWTYINEKVDLVDKLDELSNVLAFKIKEKIGYADMCFVLQQDEFIRVYTEKERLVIKVINGAYKSSEIRAILPQHL